MLKLKLTEPTIDVNVIAKDVAGNSDKITAVFKRYGSEDSFRYLQEIIDAAKEQEDGSLLSADLLKKHIVAFKGVLLLDEEDPSKTVKIKDTREVAANPGNWKNAEECFDKLVEMYFDSLPWRQAILLRLQECLANTNLEEGKLKN